MFGQTPLPPLFAEHNLWMIPYNMMSLLNKHYALTDEVSSNEISKILFAIQMSNC